jgi:hypothetical protein
MAEEVEHMTLFGIPVELDEDLPPDVIEFRFNDEPLARFSPELLQRLREHDERKFLPRSGDA